MGTMEGGCLCGEIRYRVGGDCGVTHCHCIHCRKLPWVRIEDGLPRFDRGRRD